MHGAVNLTEIALVVVVALAGGLVLARFKQPPILGYILAGIFLGPSGLALIDSREQVGALAELGVLMLLFVIGMELSLRTFKKVWLVATLCALSQIAVGLAVTFMLSKLFAWSWGLSMLLGFVVALSSTAAVVNMLESIDELKTDLGQLTIGVLIAQDLAIVPMILILRNIDAQLFDPGLITKLVGSIALIVVLIGYLSRRDMVRLPLAKIVAGNKDLTPLVSLTFCFAAAAASGLVGLSAAYGAFLAGLFLGNTHERLALINATKPIQSTLLMIFFLSIGMLLDAKFIWDHLSTVLILLFIITVGKTALNVLILYVLRLGLSQAFTIGVILAQLGEFAFLLATVGYETKIINDYGEKLIISLTVLSLSFSPIWLTIARRFQKVTDKPDSFKQIITAIYGDGTGGLSNLIAGIRKRLHPMRSLERQRPEQEEENSVSSKRNSG